MERQFAQQAQPLVDPAAVGDNTGTVRIAGGLQVDGTTTTVNSTNLSVADLNITVADGAANAAAADGAGLTVDGASAALTYNAERRLGLQQEREGQHRNTGDNRRGHGLDHRIGVKNGKHVQKCRSANVATGTLPSTQRTA